MTLLCSDRRIPGRWFSGAGRILFLAVFCVLGLGAQTLTPLARAYRESPTPARRDALLRFAAQRPQGSSGALALLTVGVTEISQGENQDAIRHLEAAVKRLPQIADYAAFHLGRARLAVKQYDDAIRNLDAVLAASPVSPLIGQAVIVAARVYLESEAPQKAIAVLRAHSSRLPQPEGDLVLASAYEGAGELATAASVAQRVFHGYPLSKEAAEADDMLGRLREKLGAEYPPPLPGALLARAGKWMEVRNYQRARTEYDSLATLLGGAERELAQVRAAAARYRGGGTEAAYAALNLLTPSSPEADAERLYYLVQCARTLENPQAMLDFAGRLNLSHSASPWRLSALIWAGNYYLLRNEPASYVPLFRACYEGFPNDPQAATCHWKVAWDAYLQRRGEAGQLLRDHLSRFPQSDKRPAALYFLGRLSEASDGPNAARPFYREILERFPGNYYTSLASDRPGSAGAVKVARLEFAPNAVNQRRISRSRLLSEAALAEFAEAELRFAAREDGQPQVLATELARQASARGAPDQALRYIKGVFTDYLSTPYEAAPAEFWRLAFPMPFRWSLERYGKTHRLDVYLLAGLIRQESEFNPRAISSANARGLMQILPSVGRSLSRTLKTGAFQIGMLFTADYNIRLGTYYFRALLDELDGSEEAALASYNGGKNRVDEWKTWAAFKEPAEFVETIPFTETRTYVQAVLRNAWLYRRIYGTRGQTERSPESLTF